VIFDIDPLFSFKQPGGYAKPVFFAFFDTKNTQTGDYLVGESTFFAAGQEIDKPLMCVSCNQTLSRGNLHVGGPPVNQVWIRTCARRR
jgi:hypothetical protein